METDSPNQDSDEGVELSPTGGELLLIDNIELFVLSYL